MWNWKNSAAALAVATTTGLGLGFAQAAPAAGPLVSVDWVKENLETPNVVFLDIRSRTGGASKEDYKAGHIPGAVYSNYASAGWRVKNDDGVGGMLPSEPQLEALIGGLGVSNDDHVVIVTSGGSALDMGSATRVYWTFLVSGHEKVSVLNGGMRAYLAEQNKETKKPVNPLSTGVTTRPPAIFDVVFNEDLRATKEEVMAAVESGDVQLIDHRPDHHHLGLTKPGPVSRVGTLPGASNVPESWLTVNGGGLLRNQAEIDRLFEAAGVSQTGETINFCNTGHWASLGWFANYAILGNEAAQLYDGSMTEWARDESLPVEVKIDLK